ncbi:ABC transporter ATP-binding protein [Roseomonas sp. NAR14]|uniref:ABC transporter ATP-binding protein n=1 Tax=Roseomonas acroporae TaxID=2937791 RepID=A0A9X2BYZ4_9PROT|nr:ABC transporter ATP-binding protein [Roseomonas acroporae]MCK8787514.1 ABC transporter ATP-binding protein [Roseomonas acroporae]
MARITLDGIAHAYRPNPRSDADYALKPLHLTWERGLAYALLGPSGCGKTTLLNILSGLLRPSHGRLLFDGVDVTDWPTERRNIAQVFQFPVIYDTMTVRENLAFPLRNRGVAPAAAARRVTEIAELLGLSPMLDRRARGLTPDAKQKISLGRGLVRSDVAALLLDEPLTVIDPNLKWELRSRLKAAHRALDRLMVYVTHDQTEALTFADRVVVMQDGRMLQIGTPAELFERPEHVFVGHFIGSPGMNFLPAAVTGDRAVVAGFEIPLGAAYGPLPAGVPVQLGIRPDFTALGAGPGGLPVTLERVDDLGRLRLARVRLGPHPLVARLPDGVDPATAALYLDSRRLHVYADGKRVPPPGELRQEAAA